MVNLSSIEKSNAQLGQYFTTFRPVALFVGATNGIGKNSLKSFVRSTRGSKPHVFFVGRSRQRGDVLRSELVAINPDGEYEFISADVGQIAVVDEVCQQIVQKEKYINLLYMSQGTADFHSGKLRKPTKHCEAG